jgi:hypothetical protein
MNNCIVSELPDPGSTNHNKVDSPNGKVCGIAFTLLGLLILLSWLFLALPLVAWLTKWDLDWLFCTYKQSEHAEIFSGTLAHHAWYGLLGAICLPGIIAGRRGKISVAVQILCFVVCGLVSGERIEIYSDRINVVSLWSRREIEFTDIDVARRPRRGELWILLKRREDTWKAEVLNVHGSVITAACASRVETRMIENQVRINDY